MRVPVTRVSEIVNGQRAITADMALRLGRYFGTGAGWWLRLQNRHELDVAEDVLGDRLEAEVLPREGVA